MKVLSDNTADRLLRHLDAAEGGITPRRIPRGASTTPPALMWQIHVTPDGSVTVDGGDVYLGGTRHSIGEKDLGTAAENSLVVWQDTGGGGRVTLESTSWEPEDDVFFRIIGEIQKTQTSWYSRQFVHGPIELDGTQEEKEPPPCGNPLNRDDDYNPVGGGATSHPLDGEGDGGYTPTCFGEDAA